MHAIAQRRCVRRRHEPASGAHEQWVARGGAQPRERAAHRGGAQSEPARGAGHAPFGQQHVERGDEVQVDVFHPDSIRYRTP